MRTFMIIFAGLLLWGVSIGVARLLGSANALQSWTVTTVFTVLWLMLAATNMWVGVTRAGYSFGEELPIFLVIFLFPVAVAIFVKWKFR